MELRPYQSEIIPKLRNSIATGNKRLVLQLATGGGKTVIASDLVSRVVSKGRRVLFVVDSIDLLEQAVNTFERCGLSVGVIQGIHEKSDMSKKVQVCTAQTLDRRLKKEQLWMGYDVGMVIIDECHIQHKVRQGLLARYPDAIYLGLTATPFARGMGLFYQDMIKGVSMPELISQKYLCDYQVYAPSSPDMKGCKTNIKGDYQESDAAERYDDRLHADILKTYRKHGLGRRTLGFACNVSHSKALNDEFHKAGFRSAHIDGYATSKEGIEHRRVMTERFRNGELDVLWNVGIATKGFDVPECSCLIIARPTKSMMLHFQIFGRGLRISEGKTDCIVLDHAGNTLRNGFPTEFDINELDDREKGSAKNDRKPKEEPLPKPCPSCDRLKPARVHKCPYCHFAPEHKELVPTTNEDLVAVRGGVKITSAQKQEWYSALLTYAKNRGYQRGWAYYKYIEKFGVRPSGLKQVPGPTSPDVDRFVNSITSKGYYKSKKRRQRSSYGY